MRHTVVGEFEQWIRGQLRGALAIRVDPALVQEQRDRNLLGDQQIQQCHTPTVAAPMPNIGRRAIPRPAFP
jgi:hypothetical protein